MKIREVIPSEYKAVFIGEDGLAYANGWVGGTTGAKVLPYNGNHKFISGNGGLYNTLLLKENGDVYVNNQNSTDLKLLQYDVNGNEFYANAVECQMQTYFAIRTDGMIWMQGYNSSKWFGTDTNLILNKWNKIPGQPNVKFKAIVKGIQLVALTDDGIVYTLSNGSTNWVKKSLPGAVEKILANDNGTYIAIIKGLPVGWGQSRYLTGVTGTISTYKDLATDWGVTAPLRDIALNANTVHFIDSEGKLWGMGDNAQGEVGNGWELINKQDLYKGKQYVWNWVSPITSAYQEIAFVPKPVHIRTDKLFTRVFGGGTYSYYKYAIDTEGKLYSWGRNKSVVLGNGVSITNESVLPNAIDVLTPIEVDPFTYSTGPSDLLFFVPGTLSAGSDQVIDTNSVLLQGTATPSASKKFSYKIVSWEWTKKSGPSCKINSTGNAGEVAITEMSNGTYVFELKVTDDNTATMVDTVSITVDIKNQAPTVTAFKDQFIVGTSTVLFADAEDIDGNIVNVRWEKVGGPDGDIIGSPEKVVTRVSFTNIGKYIYKITAIDDKGATAADEVAVTVISLGVEGYDNYIQTEP